jgi:hypothetical protein
MSELSDKIKLHLGDRVQNGELNNNEIIEILDSLASFLNLKTISDYAKAENITYNGVLKRIEQNKVSEYILFGVKFIIDNE